jgi:transposase
MEKRARRTTRQSELLTELAFALGGEPGAREAAKLGIKVSGDTLIRLILKTPLPQRPTPRVLGVDDWAKHKGTAYGTILVDLERHCPVDLLEDRKADTLVKWLQEHQGVEIISRDRASGYADGGRRGAPQAIQVADRWHILKNLGDHLKKMFERKNACLLEPPPTPILVEPESVTLITSTMEENPAGQTEVEVTVGSGREGNGEGEGEKSSATPLEPEPKVTPSENEANTQVKLEVFGELDQAEIKKEAKKALALSRKSYLFEQIKLLKREDWSQRSIAEQLKVSRTTVQKYQRASQLPRYTPTAPRPSKLNLYKPFIAMRWGEGVCKTIEVFEEIKARGYSGSWSLLAQYLAQYRLGNPPPKAPRGRGRKPGTSKKRDKAKAPQAMLSAREAAFLMLKREDKLTEEEEGLLAHLCGFDEEVEATYYYSLEFGKLVRERQGQLLEEWLVSVEQKVGEEELFELGSFVKGIRQDQAAVQTGMTLEYSQGQTEGQVNRLKTIKRSMYGRAGFELLKARVLHATAA